MRPPAQPRPWLPIYEASRTRAASGLTDDQRRRLAAKGRRLARRVLRQVAMIVARDTILRSSREKIIRALQTKGRKVVVVVVVQNPLTSLAGELDDLTMPAATPLLR
jgi:hypothetical protein